MPAIDKASFGYVAESTWGTPVTVTKFVPLISEGLKLRRPNFVSAGLRSGLHTPRGGTFVAWSEAVEGPITVELTNKTWGTLGKHSLGQTTTTGPNADGAYTHILAEASMFGLGLSAQINRPDSSDTNRAFTYSGLSVVNWEIAQDVGAELMWTMGVVGKAEDTGTAYASPSYAAALTPFDWTQITTFTVGGSAVNARSLKFGCTIPKNTTRTRLTGVTSIGQPVQNGWRNYAGTLVLDFDSLTDVNRFYNSTSSAIQVVWTGALIAGASNYKLTLDIPQAKFTGDTPNLSGADFPLALTMPFTAFYNDAASPCSLTYISTDVSV